MSRTDLIAAIAKDIQADGGTADHHELDVTSLESMRSFVQATHDQYGRVDVLVNNAGIMPLSMLDALKVDEWNRMIDVNIRGVLHGIAAVLPLMRSQGAGHIVNIASVSGHRVDPTAAVYSATKFAVRAISEGLRQESRDLRVTIVSPGLTRSELTMGISDTDVREAVQNNMEIAIPAAAIAEAINYAISQPSTSTSTNSSSGPRPRAEPADTADEVLASPWRRIYLTWATTHQHGLSDPCPSSTYLWLASARRA